MRPVGIPNNLRSATGLGTPSALLRADYSKALFLFCLAAPSYAASPADIPKQCFESRGTWQAVEENDVAGIGGGSDEFYTQGLLLAHHYNQDCEPTWTHPIAETIEQLWSFDSSTYSRQISLKIGQNFFTPGRIDEKQLIRDDRPYAAWLYVGESLSYLSPLAPLTPTDQDRSNNLNESDKTKWFKQNQHFFDLQVGWIGPAAGGELVQREFHDWVGAQEPLGWDNQLSFEPGIFAYYNRAWRFGLANRHFDIMPSAGVSVGNIQTYASAGATARFGINITSPGHSPIEPTVVSFSGVPPQPAQLSRETSAERMKPRACWFLSECYLLFGFELRAVGHNVFLDGNTIRDSHSVDKEPFVYDIMWGFRARWPAFQVDYTFVQRSREFTPVPQGADERDGRHAFGSVSVRWSF